MNEKLQYASMLEIPVSTCNVTFKPKRKKLFKSKKKDNPEEVKAELLEKVNSMEDSEAEEQAEQYTPPVQTVTITEGASKRKQLLKKPSVIAVAVVGALVALIVLTNAFYPSGINAFMNSVFGSNAQVSTTDDRTFINFTPCISFSGGEVVADENGNLVFLGKGSVYAGCDGEVSSVSLMENGKYVLEIAHSDNFSSVISGLDFVYANVGDKVFGNIPVGYVNESIEMCFIGQDKNVITDYQVVDNTVIWDV